MPRIETNGDLSSIDTGTTDDVEEEDDEISEGRTFASLTCLFPTETLTDCSLARLIFLFDDEDDDDGDSGDDDDDTDDSVVQDLTPENCLLV